MTDGAKRLLFNAMPLVRSKYIERAIGIPTLVINVTISLLMNWKGYWSNSMVFLPDVCIGTSVYSIVSSVYVEEDKNNTLQHIEHMYTACCLDSAHRTLFMSTRLNRAVISHGL